MTIPRPEVLLIAAGLMLPWLALAATNTALPLPAASSLMPPLPPFTEQKSPITLFRNLLAQTPGERRQSLSNRPPEIQKRLLGKVREYESLKPDERELRLRTTELQWYLQPLMSLPPTNRVARLAALPLELRPLVEERLARWDGLPAALQEELINHETTAHYFTQLESATTEQKQKILAQMSPERRAKLEAGLDRWRELSETQREKTLAGFTAFFELTPVEKQKALASLSAAEQQQLEKTLQSYASLPPAQRAQCLRSFEKFAGMSLEDRQAFLKNAERWKLLSPTERETWRTLVKFAPMLPPSPSPVLLPPRLPAPKKLARPASAVATNGN
jgi:hypothetical protein